MNIYLLCYIIVPLVKCFCSSVINYNKLNVVLL